MVRNVYRQMVSQGRAVEGEHFPPKRTLAPRDTVNSWLDAKLAPRSVHGGD